MKMPHSIDISKTRFAELLALRRRALGLSKVDLAEKASISGKVVHQIETGSRVKFLEKTLLLLAEAVKTPLEELLQPLDSSMRTTTLAPPNSRPSRIGLFALGAVFLVAIPVMVMILRAPQMPAILVIGNTIHAKNAATGKLVWSRTFESNVYLAEPSPWRDRSIVATLDLRGPEGGRVLLLDGRTGKTIWERSPDPSLAEAAFGEGVLDGVPAFAPIMCRYLDLDGDGTTELAVAFAHARRYPSCVMVMNRRGAVLGEYFNRGHVHDMSPVDLDGTGRQALVCVGANCSRLFQGGTVFVLDHEHWRGAAVDPLSGGNPDVVDGSRRRILTPAFDHQVMRFLGNPRVEATRVSTARLSNGSVRIMATIGSHDFCFHLMLDTDLNPLELKRTDNIPITVALWPVDDPVTYGPNCPEWRNEWMQGIVRVDRYALAGPVGDPVIDASGVAPHDPAGLVSCESVRVPPQEIGSPQSMGPWAP